VGKTKPAHLVQRFTIPLERALADRFHQTDQQGVQSEALPSTVTFRLPGRVGLGGRGVKNAALPTRRFAQYDRKLRDCL